MTERLNPKQRTIAADVIAMLGASLCCVCSLVLLTLSKQNFWSIIVWTLLLAGSVYFLLRLLQDWLELINKGSRLETAISEDNPEDIYEVISALEELLKLWEARVFPAWRRVVLGFLLNGYKTIFQLTGFEEMAIKAEESGMAALALLKWKRHQRERVFILMDLGSVFLERYQKTGDLQLALRSEKYYISAAQENPIKQQVTVKRNLGSLYLRMFQYTQEEAQLVAARELLIGARNVQAEDASIDEKFYLQLNLGDLFGIYYQISGNLDDAQKAEEYYQGAYEYAKHVMHLPRVAVQRNLAELFSVRYQLSRDEYYFHRAESVFRQLLEDSSQKSVRWRWAELHQVIGDLYLVRTDYRADKEYAFVAAEHYLEALSVFDVDTNPIQWISLQQRMAELNTKLYGHTGQLEHFENAYDYYQAVLQVIESYPTVVDWNAIQLGLGNLHAMRYENAHEDEHFNISRLHYKAILETNKQDLPAENMILAAYSLGNLYATQIELDQPHPDVDKAVNYMKDALELARNQIWAKSYEMQISAMLSRLMFWEENWQGCVENYQRVIDIMGELVGNVHYRTSKETWLRKMQDLPSCAAFAFAKLDQLEQAVHALEAGRTRLLTESLEIQTQELERLPSMGFAPLYEQYKKAAGQLRHLQSLYDLENGFGSLLWRGDLRAANVEFETVINNIRQVPLFHDFLQPWSFQMLAEKAVTNTVIFIVMTKKGSMALILQHKKVQPTVWLPFSDKALRSLLLHTSNDKVYDGFLMSQLVGISAQQALTSLLPWVGIHIVAPLIGPLSELESKTVTFITTGLTSLLPLHAAPYSNQDRTKTLLDDYTVTYAPSLRALVNSFDVLTSHDETNLTFTFDLLGVGNPLPIDEDLPALDFAALEADLVTSFFSKSRLLLEYEAMKQSVVEFMKTYSHWHFACHGYFDFRKPIESGITLANHEDLKLRDLLGESRFSRVRLAVLSACQTAIVDINKLPEEALGLPAGFLEAGIPGVIGTLWQVSDLSTTVLMVRFYHNYLGDSYKISSHPVVMHPAEALRQAQLWLRSTKNREIKEFLHEYLQGPHSRNLIDYRDVIDKRFLLEKDDEYSFSSPFYWAGFVFHGA